MEVPIESIKLAVNQRATMNKSINQSMNQSISQSVNQSMNQSIMNQSINQSINQSRVPSDRIWFITSLDQSAREPTYYCIIKELKSKKFPSVIPDKIPDKMMSQAYNVFASFVSTSLA